VQRAKATLPNQVEEGFIRKIPQKKLKKNAVRNRHTQGGPGRNSGTEIRLGGVRPRVPGNVIGKGGENGVLDHRIRQYSRGPTSGRGKRNLASNQTNTRQYRGGASGFDEGRKKKKG